MKKHLGLLTVLAVIALTVFFYFRFFFVFGEGVKSGELNYVVYKGVLFKTYEGKLIQTGIRSKEAGSIQSYEFEFSVEDPALARELMLQGGRTLELHYKEYFGAALAGLYEIHRRQHRHHRAARPPGRGAAAGAVTAAEPADKRKA